MKIIQRNLASRPCIKKNTLRCIAHGVPRVKRNLDGRHYHFIIRQRTNRKQTMIRLGIHIHLHEEFILPFGKVVGPHIEFSKRTRFISSNTAFIKCHITCGQTFCMIFYKLEIEMRIRKYHQGKFYPGSFFQGFHGGQ